MFKELESYIRKNGPGIATVCSMALTALSVYFAIKKAPEGASVMEEYDAQEEALEEKALADRKSTDILNLKVARTIAVAKTYKESLICAAGAIGCTWWSNKVNGKTIAALGAALSLNEEKLAKVYKKSEEIFGKGTAEDFKEAVNCDIPPFDEDDVVKAKAKHKKEPVERFWESWAGVPFESNARDVNLAIERAKQLACKDNGYLNYNKWRSLLGLPDSDLGVVDSWDREHPFDVCTKIVFIDGQEYIALIYSHDPTSKNIKNFIKKEKQK